MGGRGCGLDVRVYLSRSEKEQTSEYKGLGPFGNIKFVKPNRKNAGIPIFSHTPNRVYVLVGENDKIKEIGIYDSNRINKYVIHLNSKNIGPHEHRGLKHIGHEQISKSHKNLISYVTRLYNEHKSEWDR